MRKTLLLLVALTIPYFCNRYLHEESSQVKCIINSTEFGDIRYKPNGYFEWGHHGNAQAPL